MIKTLLENITMQQHIGISLIELVISLMLISTLLLGMDAMQIASLQQLKSAYYFAVAQQQMSVITARFKVSQKHRLQESLNRWNEQNGKVLPQGRGIITGDYPHYRAILFWGKWNEEDCKNNT